MFYKTDINSIINNVSKNVVSGNQIKIGAYARAMIIKLIEDGKVTNGEIQQMLTLNYSKQTFHLQYPVLVKKSSQYDGTRYYVTPLIIGKDEYLICSQWYETAANNVRPYLEKWIEGHI